jgi:GntR family transcriptional regulator/MocR family aminotransferase
VPQLDRTSKVPVHRQLSAALRQAVAVGSLRVGARLPSTRSLAAQLGVARSTVATVFEQIAAERYIESRQGSGFFVAPPLAPTVASGFDPKGDATAIPTALDWSKAS